ncbi:MAG: hypothetical protein K5756_02860 [Clostridiales bacterium]|nr:hypothetical protein [Clostridiales bacterium]
MQTFKKIAVVCVVFVLSVSIVSLAVIEPFLHSRFAYFNDSDLRESLSGKIDCLFVGASQCTCAFIPSIADNELNVCSYNLANGSMSWYGRKVLMEQEINRNPVKNVIVEISFDGLAKDYYAPWGDYVVLCRLGSFKDRAGFVFKNVSITEYQEIYGALISQGICYMISLVKNLFYEKILHREGEPLDNVPVESKGFRFRDLDSEDKEDFNISENSLKEIYNSQLIPEFNPKNLKELYEIVDICKANNVQVTFVVVPHSDMLIFEYKNWDELSNKLRSVADELNCTLLDFNLIKDRYDIFQDKMSFNDKSHLSREGASAFMEEFCKVMKKLEAGENVSDCFYGTYAEMKADSPYMEYLSK